MKKIIFVGLYIMTIVLLASCQKQISLFNHVPKDYYTRHHSHEIKPQAREPILCLQKSKKEHILEPKRAFYRNDKSNFDSDLTVSDNAESSYIETHLDPFTNNAFNEKE